MEVLFASVFLYNYVNLLKMKAYYPEFLHKLIEFFGCSIWGEQGQAALEKASICLLNCGPTGSESVKNLVLGGIGSITIVDGSKVEVGDLGNNFMGIIPFPLLVMQAQ